MSDRVCGISKLSLVPSIPMCSVIITYLCVFFDVMSSGENNVLDDTLNANPHRAGWKVSLITVGIEPAIPTVVRLTFQPARCGYTLRVASKTLYSPECITSKDTHKKL
jgi:hypothetical protein